MKPVPVLRQANGSDQGAVLLRRRIYPLVQAPEQRSVPVAAQRSGAAEAGCAGLPLAHGRAGDRAEKSDPEMQAKRYVLVP